MFYATVQQFAKSLKNLDAILGKAIAHAEARKFDPNNFCAMRLAPDMFMFAKQVQTATDIAKGAAASFTGKEAPKFDDQEKTMNDLRARLHKCISHLEAVKADDIKVQPEDRVKIPYPPNKMMLAQDALLQRALPNFYFHISAAYIILLHCGVEIGKPDYLGPLHLLDG